MKKSILISLLGFVIVLTTTILIILYAKGYNYNFLDNKVEKTGILKINATPTGSNVYLNSELKGKAPISIFDLNPGEYTLILRKDGFTSWSSKVKLIGGQISIVYPILYPSNIKPVIQENRNINDIYFGKQAYAYTASENNQLNLYSHIFDSGFLSSNENTQLVTPLSTINSNSQYNLKQITFSNSGRRMLIEMSGTNNIAEKYYFTNSDGSSSPIDLDTVVNTKLYQKITWGNDDNHLLLSSKTLLSIIDLNNNQEIILSQVENNSNIDEFISTDEGIIYFVKSTTDTTGKVQYELFSIQADGTSLTKVNTSEKRISNIFYYNKVYAYSIAGQGIIIYEPNTGSNIVISSKSDIYTSDISKDTTMILYKDNKGNLFTFSTETLQSYSLKINMDSIGEIMWDKFSRIILYTKKDNNTYSISGVNYDGSNNDLLAKSDIIYPNFIISPTSEKIIFVMNSISNIDQKSIKQIYQLVIPGL